MMQFSVAVDSHFLPKPVEEIIQKQEFSKVPLITGITDDEFGYLLPTVSKYYIYYYRICISIHSIVVFCFV